MNFLKIFNKEIIRDLLFIFLTAGLLILAFPRTDFWPLAWFALVPLLLILENKGFKNSFNIGFLTGFLFFWGVLYWFVHVTIVGAFLLISYLSFYFGFFAIGNRLFAPLKLRYKALLLPSFWVFCEYVRAHLFTGFGWACLGHSQYKNILMIQMADITGVFGISFIIVLTNLIVKEWIKGGLCADEQKRQELKKISIGIFFVLVIVGLYGGYALKTEAKRISKAEVDDTMRLAIVQANIPQHEKWNESSWPLIMEKYVRLTREVSQQKPDLIIWPETSFPGFLWEDIGYFTYLRDFVRDLNISLLFGSVIHENEKYYNSTILLANSGEVVDTYNKLHLVPYGEYVPFRKYMPLVAEFVPIEDFTPGKQYTNFPIISKYKNKFSSLICFEDTVAKLSREFTKKGSGLLINMTNDAWFEDTKAPFMHLQSSIFRSIENRRYLVRAANTGVSCVINPVGKIINRIENEKKKPTYIQGHIVEDVQFRDNLSFYTKFGDVFTYMCILGILSGIGVLWANNKKENKQC